MTQYLGFPTYGDEYKVMGLAPYGEPRFKRELEDVLLLQGDGSFRLNLRYFRHHVSEVSYQWNNCVPSVDDLFSEYLTDLLGPKRSPNEELTQKHRDLARSVQEAYEGAFFNLLRVLGTESRQTNLALAGGCIQNSVANGKVRPGEPFQRVYVPPAAGDAGGAIGARSLDMARALRRHSVCHESRRVGTGIFVGRGGSVDCGPRSGVQFGRLHRCSRAGRGGAIEQGRCRRRRREDSWLGPGTNGVGASGARQPLDHL